MIQIKTRLAGNGWPLSRVATQSWIILGSPFGLSCASPTDIVIETYCRMTTAAFRCLAVNKAQLS
ncbi:MAG: hypothetical protein BMS9Abin25_0050 [Gammaproteobacteria bacterium]|nr:MAG: hypothetical protein BMS9Abin25_0050 [Gammaproteobacteria bacterium]